MYSLKPIKYELQVFNFLSYKLVKMYVCGVYPTSILNVKVFIKLIAFTDNKDDKEFCIISIEI